MSKSQLNQDIKVLEFFNFKKNGYFLDIGANNGITLSNSYLLEKEYNWDGICSEPLPYAFKTLKKNRKVICDNHAVFSSSRLLLNFSQSSLTSGITNYVNNYKKDEIIEKANVIKVKTITLKKLLRHYKAPKRIDYLSLDTEGTELEILKSADFARNIFLYINVEHNYNEIKRKQIRNLLLNNNYLYLGENKFDDDYIHKSMFLGKFYFHNNYNKPIIIKKTKNKNEFKVKSPYWDNDTGVIKDGYIIWNRLGKGKIYHNHIEYENNSKWERDKRK